MDEYIKISIDSRKNSLFNLYEITDENIKNKIEELFKKIEEFGKTCSNAGDFEVKFATSELNTEYINMFTELSTKYTMKPQEQSVNTAKTDKEEAVEKIKDEAEYVLDNASLPARKAINKKIAGALKDVPIVGDVVRDDTPFVGTIIDKLKGR